MSEGKGTSRKGRRRRQLGPTDLEEFAHDREAETQIRGGPVVQVLGALMLLSIAACILAVALGPYVTVAWITGVMAGVLVIGGAVWGARRQAHCPECGGLMKRHLVTPPESHWSYIAGGGGFISGTDAGRGAVYSLDRDHDTDDSREVHAYRVRGDYRICLPCKRYALVKYPEKKRMQGGRRAVQELLEHHDRSRRRRRKR